ncbi:hypothetical protein [Clostridium uliginosum]|nr:hypothetical protein [Clostridium uliginosum]
MLIKKLKRVISCAVLIFCMIPTTAFAGTWKQCSYDPEKWQYLEDDGNYARDRWLYDNGSWYYIRHDYYMAQGVPARSKYEDIGGDYCFEQSGKLATGGFVVRANTNDRFFTNKEGHPVDGLFMVDGVLYQAYSHFLFGNNVHDSYLCIKNDSYYKYDSLGSSRTKSQENRYTIECKYDNGKILDRDGKPFAANSKIYTQIKYLPQYDSKGNLIGEIQNPNGYSI